MRWLVLALPLLGCADLPDREEAPDPPQANVDPVGDQRVVEDVFVLDQDFVGEPEFFLTEIAGDDTVEVRDLFEGMTFEFEPETDFFYDGVRNSVRFTEFVPGPGHEVRISYIPAALLD